MQYLIPGLDPTGQPCVSVADLLQMILAAKPADGVGFLLVQQDAPNVVTNPEQARCLWLSTVSGVLTGDAYYYDGSAWELLIKFNVDNIPDGSITIEKLAPDGGSPYQIIQLNSTASEFIFTTVIDAIANGTLPVTKLLMPGGNMRKLFGQDVSNAAIWYTLSTLAAYFDNGSIPLVKIEPPPHAANGYLVWGDPNGTVQWAQMDLSDATSAMLPTGGISIQKLARVGALPLQVLRINAAGNAWEIASPTNQLSLVCNYATFDANDVDIPLTKPLGTTWRYFEVSVDGVIGSSDGSGQVVVDSITFQTAPSIGIAVGTGNTGMVFNAGNNDFAPLFCKIAGNAPALLIADTIAIRVSRSITPNCNVQKILHFVKGYYS